MATVIQKAVRGQRKAIEFLYQANKQKIFFIAKSLLLNDTQAQEATVWAFRNVWSVKSVSRITTEDEFTHLVIKKVVEFCKKKVTKHNSEAFNLPLNKDFLISADKSCKDKDILSQLPELQRYIFVLHTIGNYSNDDLAGTFKFNVKIINIALEAEKVNCEKICSQSYKDTVNYFLSRETDISVPDKVDEQVAAAIDNIVSPIEKKCKKKIAIISIIAVVLCLCIVGGIFLATRPNNTVTTTSNDNSSVSDTETSNNTTESSSDYTFDELDEDTTYYADIEIRDYGTVTIQLNQKSAPITCANFVSLAKSGFYDGLTFHRIMEGFMMQGGDPNGNGTGGSENTIVGEFSDNGYENNLSHTRGAVSMARSSNDYDSASSQFFIVHKDSTFLDGQYAVFGYVTEGLEVVDAVCEDAEPTDNNGTIESDAQPIITSITIRTE